jgi:hypothetical protein
MKIPTFHSRALLSQMHRTSHRVCGQVIDYHLTLLSQRGYATSICHLRLPHCNLQTHLKIKRIIVRSHNIAVREGEDIW